MKKLLFLLTFMFFLCLFFSINTSAATFDALTYEVLNGEVKITYCRTYVTEVVIPETIDGYPVTQIQYSAFQGCDDLVRVEIPNSVKSIGSKIFAQCTSLEEVVVPFIGSSREETGTEEAVFGYFFGCVKDAGPLIKQYYSNTEYASYRIPPSVKKVTITDAEIIPFGAFYNCYNIDTIVVNSSVDSIYSKAFYNCSSLVDITIPAKNLKMASTNVFGGCDMLTIHGIEGSDIEDYAAKYLIDFEPIVDTTTTLAASAEAISGHIVVTATAKGSTIEKFIPVAVYNENNKMLDLMIIPSNEEFEVAKIVFKDVSEASYVKLFIWESHDDLTPLDTINKVEIRR